MIEITDEEILELIKSFKKSEGVDYTFEEAREIAHNLYDLSYFLYGIYQDKKLDAKIKKAV